VGQTGQIIDDRYRLDERIAAGGAGQVWRAQDLLLERPVAVKLLRPEYAEDTATLARFRKEATHAGALSHPCVAQVYDYGHAAPDGPPYLVMEFVDGPSLADLLAVGPVEPAFALNVIAQTASGLQAAHAIGLVHRDIKPGNILLGPDGQIKITDFGIAYAAGQAPVTGPGLLMGTTLYMAPERIGGGPGTPASDLYSLGIVLHECLTAVPPYQGTPAEVMAAHLHAPLPRLPSFVPPAVGMLVARLTAKDPAMRIGDAGEVAALASRLRDSVTAERHVRAAAPTIATGQASGSRRPRPAAFAGGAALLAGAGITALLVSGALNTTPTANQMQVRPSSASNVTLGVVPSDSGGSASGHSAGTDLSATAAATRHPAGHDGTTRGGSTPSATPRKTPSAPASPSPGAPPRPSGAPSGRPSAPPPRPPRPTGSPTGPRPAPPPGAPTGAPPPPPGAPPPPPPP
jgi:serine/threonine protein kinase